MRYIYGILDNDCYDVENYYSEEDAEWDHVAIYGNKDFKSINDYTEDFRRSLSECYYDIDTIVNDDSMSTDDKLTEVKKLVKYYFKLADNSTLTDEQILTLMNLSKKFYNNLTTEEDDNIFATVAAIIYGEEFIISDIKGYSQGDWMKIMMPKAKSDKKAYIESVYFGTGSELFITDIYCVDQEEAEAARSNGDGFYDYTELYNEEDIRAYVAKEQGEVPEHIKLLIPDGSGYKEI